MEETKDEAVGELMAVGSSVHGSRLIGDMNRSSSDAPWTFKPILVVLCLLLRIVGLRCGSWVFEDDEGRPTGL